MNIDDFKDRYGPVALVTGASSGIGKAFAETLASMGLDLVLVARRLDRLEQLAAKLAKEHGVQAKAHQIDLAQPTAAQQILDVTSGFDVGLVVSNAGFGMKGEHARNDPQAMADMLMVNCNVPMQLAHGFIPRLRKRRKGGIIFTSSIEALIGCPYSAAYSASKALVNALGEGLWAELQPEGIDVLTLCPGATESEAAGKQGIDISTLQNVMRADEVARLTLENIQNGPVFLSSEYYRATFDRLLSLPRRDALMAMARSAATWAQGSLSIPTLGRAWPFKHRSLEMLEGQHYQNAYITRDIEKAIEAFRTHSAVSKVIRFEGPVELTTPKARGTAVSKLAFIWINNLQYELIQPVSGLVDIYRDELPDDDRLKLHHICMRVPEWDNFRARVDQKGYRVVLEGGGDMLKYIYIDARDFVGHYLEYVWMTPERWTAMGGE